MGRSGARHRAAGSGPRGKGVWETEGITSVGLLWEGSRGGAGCHGMQRKRGDRLTVLLDVSIDVKSGLWEGRGRSEPGRMGSHCLLGHPDILQTLSKNPPDQSPAQVMLNSHGVREASGCGMLYQGSTKTRLGKHAREPRGSKLTPGIRILTEQ